MTLRIEFSKSDDAKFAHVYVNNLYFYECEFFCTDGSFSKTTISLGYDDFGTHKHFTIENPEDCQATIQPALSFNLVDDQLYFVRVRSMAEPKLMFFDFIDTRSPSAESADYEANDVFGKLTEMFSQQFCHLDQNYITDDKSGTESKDSDESSESEDLEEFEDRAHNDVDTAGPKI